MNDLQDIKGAKALNPRYQAGVDFYRKNPWRHIYLKASDAAKRYYEVTFYNGSPASSHDTEEQRRQSLEDLKAVYRDLTDEDWDYIIGHIDWGMAKWGLNLARKRYSRKGSVQ